MLLNQLKLFIRHLNNHRLFALINLAGLTIGIASTLIVALYSLYVLNYDSFHEKAENIYMVYKERITPNGSQLAYDTWVPLLDHLKQDFPSIETGSRVYTTSAKLTYEGSGFSQQIMLADTEFFDLFSFPILYGTSDYPLHDPKSVVLSKQTASKIFGNSEAIGRTIILTSEDLDLHDSYTVSAVLDEYPSNSSLLPEVIIPFESFPNYSSVENQWNASFITTYIQVDNRGVDNLEAGFPGFIAKVWDSETRDNTRLRLLPLKKSYETIIGDIDLVYILIYTVIGILLIAIINYVNLMNARSMDRLKEISVKKTFGLRPWSIRGQFLFESVVLTSIASALSIMLVALLLPHLNQYLQLDLQISQLNQPLVLLSLFAFTIITGLLAGFYPAVYLSNIQTIKLLMGRIGTVNSTALRNVLVIVQFKVSTILIIMTLTVSLQLIHMKEADMGFQVHNLIVLPINPNDLPDDQRRVNKLNSLYNELKQLSAVEVLSFSRHIPTRWSDSFTFVKPEGWEGDPMRMRYTVNDSKFIDTYGINLETGQFFDANLESDQDQTVVLNQAAFNAMGLDPNGDNIIRIGSRKLKVIGIVDNFYFETMRNAVEPTIHLFRGHDNPSHRYLSIKVANRTRILGEIEKKWAAILPDIPFNPQFLDQNIERMYEQEYTMLNFGKIITAVAVLLASLGLFGLCAFILAKRIREISIRKVMGASVTNLTILIGTHFTKLVVVAFVFGTSISYYLGNVWLNNFSYKITFPWSVVGLTLVILFSIIALTVGHQTLRIARSNPVVTLRNQ